MTIIILATISITSFAESDYYDVYAYGNFETEGANIFYATFTIRPIENVESLELTINYNEENLNYSKKQFLFKRNCFCKHILFPGGPDFRAEACGSLFAVADNRGFHKGRIVEDLVFLGGLILHILHESYFRCLTVPVDEIVDPADCPQNAVELLAGHTVLLQIDGLEFDPPLLEIPLGFFGIKAFAFSEYLDVQ